MKASTKQRVECFMAALPDFLKSVEKYEASKKFPNNYKKGGKRENR